MSLSLMIEPDQVGRKPDFPPRLSLLWIKLKVLKPLLSNTMSLYTQHHLWYALLWVFQHPPYSPTTSRCLKNKMFRSNLQLGFSMMWNPSVYMWRVFLYLVLLNLELELAAAMALEIKLLTQWFVDSCPLTIWKLCILLPEQPGLMMMIATRFNMVANGLKLVILFF